MGKIDKQEKSYCEEIRNNLLKKVNTSKIDTKGFLKKSFEIHGDKYDYSKVNYVDDKTKVVIICPKHGLFEKIPKAISSSLDLNQKKNIWNGGT